MRTPRLKSRGVTMIEIMVAMAIMALMMTAVWNGFRGTVKGMEIAEKDYNRETQVRGSLLRMSSELSMAYLSFNRPTSELRHFTLFEGRRGFDGDAVTFSSFAHLRVRKDSNEGDQSLIQYFVSEDPDDSRRKHLYRRESRRLTGDLPEYLEQYYPAFIILEDVETIDFDFWDGRKQEWLEEWATIRTDAQPDRLPERVRIELTLRDPDGQKRRYFVQTELFMQEKIDFAR